MATNVGTIELIATIDTSGYKKGAREIDSANKDIEGSVDKADGVAKRTTASLAGLASKGFLVASAAAVALGTAITAMTLKGGISRALNIEDAQAKLRGLGHDTASVATIMQNALDSVRGTSFGLDAAATTAANAVASGVKPGAQLAQVLKTVANTSALAGRDMSELGAIFNKVAASNKVQMDVINQLHDAGVPALALIAKEIGKTAEETAELASAGEINFETFERAMRKGVGDAAIEMGKTTRGSWANMQAAMSRVGAAIVKDIIPRVRDSIQGLTQWFDANLANIVNTVTGLVMTLKGLALSAFEVGRQVGEYLIPKLSILWRNISEQLIPILKDLWQNVIKPLIPVIGVSLVLAIGLVVDIINAFVVAIGWLYNSISSGNPILLGLIGLFGTLAAVMAFNAVFNALTIGFNTLRLITIPQTMASITALKTLVMTPMVMPALVIGAAIASAVAVYNAVQSIKGAIDAVNNAAKAAGANNDEQIRNLQKQAAAARAIGDTAAVNKISNAIKALGYAEGGFTGLGGKYDVAGIVHRGEFVIPKEAVDQSTGMPKIGASHNITINLSGIMTRSKADERDVAKSLIARINEELKAKNAPILGGGAI